MTQKITDPREFANTSDNVENTGFSDDPSRLINPIDFGREEFIEDENDNDDFEWEGNGERFD